MTNMIYANNNVVIEGLVLSLSDSDPVIRYEAANALVQLGSEVALLLTGYLDIDGVNKRALINTLGLINNPLATEKILRYLEDEDEGMRASTLIALSLIERSNAVPYLVKSLNDVSSIVKQDAAGCLHDVGDSRAVEPLNLALNNPDVEFRFNVVYALSAAGDISSMLPLKIIIENDSAVTESGHTLKEAARYAVKEIQRRRTG